MDLDSCKSTSSIVFYIDGILVGWKSRKQTLVVQSTMEAEMISTSTALRTVRWLDGITKELRFPLTKPILYNDGLNNVTTLRTGNFQSNSRHLRIGYYGIYESIARGIIDVIHKGSPLMIADALTKALPGLTIKQFRTDVGLVNAN
jgi:hypothetical protein